MSSKYIVKPFTIEYGTKKVKEYAIFNTHRKTYDTFKSYREDKLVDTCAKLNNIGEHNV